MTLRDFTTDLDREGVTRRVKTVVAVTETIEVRPHRPSDALAYVAKPDSLWTWSDLRDYVVSEVEGRFGTIRRDHLKESAIFKSFLARWGQQAPMIARFVFGPQQEGYWRGSPVTVTSFCKNADPHFAQPISERIHHLADATE